MLKSEFPKIFVPSLLDRIAYAVFIVLPAVGLFLLTSNSHRERDWFLFVFSSTLTVASLCLMALCLTERVILNPPYLIRRSAFGEQRIALTAIRNAKRITIGRGNTALSIEMVGYKAKMGSFLRTEKIEELASIIQPFLDKAQTGPAPQDTI